jgi:hypothetical protein
MMAFLDAESFHEVSALLLTPAAEAFESITVPFSGKMPFWRRYRTITIHAIR